jgi:hypothetical protein
MGSGSSGDLQKGTWGLTHLLIMVDKFTKWAEAKPLANLSSKQAVDFIQYIIFCFGYLIPSLLTTALSSPEKSS